jgi:Spy/CpxP family protein refolding chaperone
MRTRELVCLLALLLPVSALAQGPGGPPPHEPGSRGMGNKMGMRHEMGKWWQNSEIARKLQLSDAQIAKLNQTFFDHRLKLIDDGAAMEKEDLKLQNLLDADDPSENQVGTEVDQVLAARGKLEREYTMMNLDLRKVLTVAQWKQLKSIREERGPSRNGFFRQGMPPGAGPHPPLPPRGPEGALEAPAPPGGDEMF